MTDVFISYAREDRRFVQRLHDALSNDGHEAWVDWEGIPASAKWMAEVRAAIDEADCFCFVVSPDSVESPVCREEAAHAAASNKRILPLLHRTVEDGLVPETVAAHNWIEFDQEQDFDRSFATLVKALETEPEHLRTHTRLLVRAKEWEGAERSRSSLLRGQDLTGAEVWLGASQGKEPAPTQLHTAYVLASRKAASRRQRTTIGAVAIALVLSLVLSAVALVQRGEAQDAQARAEEQRAVAEEQRAAAEEQADLALSRQLASQALLDLDRQPDLAILLALEGYRIAPTDEARQSLLTAAQLSGSIERMIHAEGPIRAPSLSPSGDLLAGSLKPDSVTVWDLASGEVISEIGAFDGGQRSVDKLSFGATDDQLVISYGRVLVMVDPVSGEVVDGPFPGKTIEGVPPQLIQGRVDPSGRFLVVGNARGAFVWDLGSDRLVATLEHPDVVVDVEFSGDGSMVATIGGNSGEIRLWETGSWRPGPVLSGQFFATDAAFSVDGEMVVTTGSDGLVRWSTATGERIGAPLRGHDGEVVTVELTPDGSLMATGGTDGTVRLWDPATGVQVGRAIEGHDDGIRWVGFAHDGAELVVAPNDTIFVRSVDGILGISVGEAAGAIALVAFSPDGSQLVVADGPPGGIHLLDPATGDPIAEPLRNELSAWAVAVSPDGTLAVPDSAAVRVWDPSARQEVTEPLAGPGGRIWYAAFSPDGSRLAVATAHQRILLWDTATWELAGVIEEAHFGPVAYVAFSPDGSTLFSVGAYDWMLKAWDVADLTQVGEPAEAFAPLSVNVSPDGDLVVSTGQERPLALYGPDLSSIPPFATDAARASSSAFTPDGSVLAVGGDDGSVRLFDVATGQQLGGPVGGHPDWVMSVAFSPDGSRLVSGGQDGTIRIWDSVLWSDDLDEFRAALCPIVGRSLTQDEWVQFLPDEPYGETCG